MRVFSTGSQEYDSPDPGLGHASDKKAQLSEVLAVPGPRLRYTYDFGDDWEHRLHQVGPRRRGGGGPILHHLQQHRTGTPLPHSSSLAFMMHLSRYSYGTALVISRTARRLRAITPAKIPFVAATAAG
jgi:Plasmid pRiA4b ORF-3-like protein